MSWRWALGGDPAEFGRVSRIEIDLRPIESGTELIRYAVSYVLADT